MDRQTIEDGSAGSLANLRHKIGRNDAMRLLLLSNDGNKLKPRYKYSFAALPFALMMLSFLPWRLLMNWLASILGISMTAPARAQPHFALFSTLTTVAMVTFFVLGYVLGFVANAVILRFCYGWSAKQLRDMFLWSKAPEHWYKAGHDADHT